MTRSVSAAHRDSGLSTHRPVTGRGPRPGPAGSAAPRRGDPDAQRPPPRAEVEPVQDGPDPVAGVGAGELTADRGDHGDRFAGPAPATTTGVSADRTPDRQCSSRSAACCSSRICPVVGVDQRGEDVLENPVVEIPTIAARSVGEGRTSPCRAGRRGSPRTSRRRPPEFRGCASTLWGSQAAACRAMAEMPPRTPDSHTDLRIAQETRPRNGPKVLCPPCRRP
jgi:hypothetical protein